MPKLTAMLLALSLTPGCASGGADEGDGARAAEALDAVEGTFGEAALLAGSMAFGTMAQPTSAYDAATRAVMYVPQAYVDPSCVVAERQDTVVAFTLTDCIGKRGLLRVTGDVEVGFGVSVDGRHACASADKLQVNRATVTFISEGVYSDLGDQKALAVSTDVDGAGPRGTFKRHGAYDVAWTPADGCADFNGDWRMEWNPPSDVAWKTTVDGYRGCRGQCPTAGTVTYGSTEVTVTVRFDGTAMAKWQSSHGGAGQVALACSL